MRRLYAHLLEDKVTQISVWSDVPTETERRAFLPQVLVECTNAEARVGGRYAAGKWTLPPPRPMPAPKRSL